jgi:hypothetical protein
MISSQRFNFTKVSLDALPLPEAGKRTTYYDSGGAESVRGLQLRITSNGSISFSVFARAAGGRPERVSLGKYPDVSIEQARKKAKKALADLADGKSPSAMKRATKVESLTLAEAVAVYVEHKRRKSDKKPLKQRTKDDYLEMVAPAKVKPGGTSGVAGGLFALAHKPIRSITAREIKAVNDANLKRGERVAGYAMQVLRAVLNYHGIVVAHGPFNKDTPQVDRIDIPQSGVNEHWIEPIGRWWNAVNALPVSSATDYLKFTMLTGTRPAEPLQVLISDCDLDNGRVFLRDTKNRRDHTLALSKQAWEIVKRQAEGKTSTDHLFAPRNLPQIIQTLVKATGIEFSAKTLRTSFASHAEPLVSTYVLKGMLNHTVQSNDVTGRNYVKKSEAELRAGWQVLANFIEAQADAANADNVVTLFKLN